MTAIFTIPRLAALVSSFVAGAVFVVACSDDSPGDADAATCSCEPPLTGRIHGSKTTQQVNGNGVNSLLALCPAGETILGGGCRAITTDGLTLEEGGIDRQAGDAYVCTWRNELPSPRMATAEAICLMPAP